MLYNDYGADKDDHAVVVALGEGQWGDQGLQASSCLLCIKSKRAHLANVLYLAHQPWILIPWADHSQPSSSSKEMQSQEQLPSDLLAGLCITQPVTGPETGPLPAGSSSVWNSPSAGDKTGCLLEGVAGWRPLGWEDDTGQSKHTCSA